jgi:hypothetical protein
MESLKNSFEDVADWCERHLEAKWGREIGMTFGAMIRAYARVATIPSSLHGNQRAAREEHLNAKAEKLLGELSTRFYMAYEMKPKLQDAPSYRTNFTYDTHPTSPD